MASVISIITVLAPIVLPIVIKLLGYYLEHVAKDAEAQKKFMEFVNSLKDSPNVPAGVRKSAQRQSDRLDAILADIDKGTTK
jgi:hypothetical protein